MKRFDCPRRVGRLLRRFRANYGDGGFVGRFRGGELIRGVPNPTSGGEKPGWSRRRPEHARFLNRRSQVL